MYMSFIDIEIDRKEIPQDILNIDAKTRSNLFTWNGQFSPQFIEALLSEYSSPEFLVIDTFAGSGTTLCECARKGLEAYGTEINVSAFHMAKIYEAANLSDSERNSIIDEINSLILYLSMNSGNILEALTFEIKGSTNTFYAYVLSALVIMMDIFSNEITSEFVLRKWGNLSGIIAKIPHSKKLIRAERRDARNLNIKNDTADMLITSPPYINVFNYHQKYRRSVEALGHNVLRTARSEIGSNRKNRGNRFLTVIQYCIDMAMSMMEASRVCKDGARMIYVVGRESRIMGCPFCNSELIYDIGTGILGLDFILRQERFFTNRFGQVIYEDILHFRNTKGKIIHDELEERPRDIAANMLACKMKEADSKTLCFLCDAVNRKNIVMPSEIFSL